MTKLLVPFLVVIFYSKFYRKTIIGKAVPRRGGLPVLPLPHEYFVQFIKKVTEMHINTFSVSFWDFFVTLSPLNESHGYVHEYSIFIKTGQLYQHFSNHPEPIYSVWLLSRKAYETFWKKKQLSISPEHIHWKTWKLFQFLFLLPVKTERIEILNSLGQRTVSKEWLLPVVSETLEKNNVANKA